jgi:tetratricopeptide (TPR) repeat protein
MLEQPDPQAVLHQLDREHDNIRAALQWSLDNGDTASGLQLASLMGLYWFMRGHLSEGRAHLRRALSTQTPTQTSLLAMRASALDMSAILARYQGDYAEATALTRESLAICQSLDDRQGIANAQANLGFVLLHQGNIEAAREFYQQSLALGRALGNWQGIADAVSHLALAELYAGRFDSARAFGEECLAIWRQLGDQEGVAWGLHILGNIRLAQDDPSGALLDFSTSLSIAEGMNFRWGMVWSLEDFARLAIHYGEHGIALRLVRAGAVMRRSMGLPLPTHEHAELDRLMVSASQVLGESVAGAAVGAAEQLTWPECMQQILLLKERITAGDVGAGPWNAPIGMP